MDDLNRETRRGLELRAELDAARLNRRELAKLGLLAGAASYASGASLRAAIAQTVPAVPLTPWKDPLPVPRVHEARGGFDYRHDDHQWSNRYDADRSRCYDVDIVEHDHKFHSDLPPSRVWSFDGSFGGPVLDVRYGQAFCLRLNNRLPADHRGYGQPEPCTHLHNFHTASESDGGPWNWQRPGESRIQHYSMARAGFADPMGGANPHYADTTGQSRHGTWWAQDGTGDLRETLTTMFTHDHRPEFTAANLYKGLFMMVRAFDEDDTGDETTGWRLPSGAYDVPLLFQDKQIVAATGEMAFNQFATDGFLGKYLTVNGKYQPFFVVEPRPYRFRFLNGGPSRFYRYVLRRGGSNVPFHEITRSGNFLPVPNANITKLDLWVAERSDVIVDFSAYPDNTEIVLSNTLKMRDDGRGEDVGNRLNPDAPANQLLKFIVRRQPGRSHPRFALPAHFRPLPPLPDLSTLPRKHFKFERKNGQWAVNGRFWDPDLDHDNAALNFSPNVIARDSAELWTLESSSGGWDHPVHIHFEEGQVVRNNGRLVPAAKRYRSDVYRLRKNVQEVVLRFRDFPESGFKTSSGQAEHTREDPGRYVMHCHNVVHEDHAMMTTWSIRPPPGA
jgi:FtsP/CotA-like multicopper oxidase with cupredoxin domain